MVNNKDSKPEYATPDSLDGLTLNQRARRRPRKAPKACPKQIRLMTEAE